VVREKQAIVRREGVPVDIVDTDGVVASTRALIGRASKQFNSTLSLEHFRRGYFLPEVPVDNGYVCHNIPANEDYILVAVYPEMIRGKVATNASHMMVCNSTLDIMGDDIETADDRGNITKEPQVKYSQLKCHTQVNSPDLKLYDTGLHPDTEYVIFAPGVQIAELDRIILTNGIQTLPLKVIQPDYISYPGVVVLQVKSETRA
jgi:hypothetical protein